MRYHYKVSIPSGWRYGFATVEEATRYAGRVFARTGVIAAVVAYTPR